jgi:hypothetical protein
VGAAMNLVAAILALALMKPTRARIAAAARLAA